VFSVLKVLRKLDQFEQHYGWRPVEHSISDVDAMIRHLNDETNLIIKSRSGNIDLRRPLKAKEKQWIMNERAMCSVSCEYYLTRYYMIASESETGSSNIMHFTFRSGQRVFWKILQKLDTPTAKMPEGASKEIFCLKARKQGISTLVEGILSWMSTCIPGTKAAIASADGQKSQIMAGMFFFAIDELPWWLESTRTRDKRASDRGIVEWSHIGNQVILQSGSMRGGIGQGTTPNAVHISEASQFTNAVQQLDEGLLKAVTSNPNTFMVIETTGDGDDWTAKMWNHCKENYWKGKARLLPLFLPWFMSPELYPSKSWTAKYPMPKGWEPIAETRAMATKCRAYVASTEVLRDELGKGWELPKDAQWWWEFNYVEHKQRGIEKSFLRQHPCDDFEALIGEHDKAIGEDAIANMQRTVTNDVVGVFQVAGDGIETKHEPNRELIVHGDEALRLFSEWKNHKGESYEWGFIPTEGAIAEQAWNPLKKVIVYEEPRPGYLYGIGVDTGTGVGLDRSIICVTRKGMDEDEPDKQVCEFADDTIGQTDLWAWVAAVTALYSRHYDPDALPSARHPKLCIELRRKVGDMTFNQLYHSLHFRNHNWFVQLDKTTFKPKPGNAGRPGFFTNSWSRPLLLGFFTSSIENGWYEVKSRFLQDEIKNAEIKVMASGRSRMDHSTGRHDDRVFGAAMSHWTLHDVENLAEWSKKKYYSAPAGPMMVDYAPAGMMAQNCGTDWLSKR
jgi:hypothetical protein